MSHRSRSHNVTRVARLYKYLVNWIITGQKFLDEQCYERLHLATRLQKGLQASLNRGGKFVACPCAGTPVSGPMRLEMETHSFADWLKEHEEFITTFTTGTCRLRWQEVSRTRPQCRHVGQRAALLRLGYPSNTPAINASERSRLDGVAALGEHRNERLACNLRGGDALACCHMDSWSFNIRVP
jgi:hypothetical protein